MEQSYSKQGVMQPQQATEQGRSSEAVGRSHRLPYLPGLDGLRAVAVVAVLLYHADIPWVPGGFLGVEVFFVISGYLITTLLLAEWRIHGGATGGWIDPLAFWLRRARRLLPALYVAILAVMLYVVLVLPEEVSALRGDAAAASTYLTNWYLILSHKPYFETVGRPSLLRHLWSLAIEEQFYLLWPLALMAMLRVLRQRGTLLLIVAGAVVSIGLMALLYQPDVDPSRVYYGSDTRASALLLGAALSFVWAPWLSPENQGKGSKMGLEPRALQGLGTAIMNMLGLLGVAGLLYLFVALDEFQPLLYRGGLAAVSLMTLLAIAAVAHPRVHVGRYLLGCAPLRWLGTRSYSVYLWHWPIFMVTRPQLDLPMQGWPVLLLRLALTALVSEMSFRLVERPIREGALGRAWAQLHAAVGLRRSLLAAGWAGSAGLLGVLLLTLGLAVARAKPPEVPAYLMGGPVALAEAGSRAYSDDAQEHVEDGAKATPSATLQASPSSATQSDRSVPTLTQDGAASLIVPSPTPRGMATSSEVAMPEEIVPPTGTPTGDASITSAPLAPASATPPPASSPSTSPVTLPSATPSPSAPASPMTGSATPTPHAIGTMPITSTPPLPTPGPSPTPAPRMVAVGDSVMLGAVAELKRVWPGIDVDALVGRQVSAGIELLRQRRETGPLDVAIVHVGNNGTFSDKQFEEMMKVLHDTRQVVMVNVRVSQRWESKNNAVIAKGVKDYRNVVLADWYTATTDQPDYFWKDGIHLQPDGARTYVQLIADALQQPSIAGR